MQWGFILECMCSIEPIKYVFWGICIVHIHVSTPCDVTLHNLPRDEVMQLHAQAKVIYSHEIWSKYQSKWYLL